MKACRARTFTFSIKILWRVTYIERGLFAPCKIKSIWHTRAGPSTRSYFNVRKQRVICNDSWSWSYWSPHAVVFLRIAFLAVPYCLTSLSMTWNNTWTKPLPSRSSLPLHADDTTQYAADNSPFVLQYTLNKDTERISSWSDHNCLKANGEKTQGMILGNSSYVYDLEFDGISISLKEHLEILGVHLDNQFIFQRTYEYIAEESIR